MATYRVTTDTRHAFSGQTKVAVQGDDATRRRHRILLHPFFFYPESWNGIDEHLLLLARYLDHQRFEPAILVHDTDGLQTRLLSERAGIRAIDAPCSPTAA